MNHDVERIEFQREAVQHRKGGIGEDRIEFKIWKVGSIGCRKAIGL